MKRLDLLLSPIVAATLAAAALLPLPAAAGPVSDHSSGQLVDVRVLVDNGAAPLYSRGWSFNSPKRYFEAFEGGHYAVELHNRTGRRIGVLLSVDGLNVVTGNRSNLTADESMYVLDPFQSTVIRGWRTSLDEVRQFVFVDEQRSYAERTGQANGDMGWLRVVAFEELRPMLGWGQLKSTYRGGGGEPPTRELGDRARRDVPAPSTDAPEGALPFTGPARASEQKADGLARDEASGRESAPGTGWGERREDHVARIEFHASPTASDQLVFRYEYASGLRALGIFPRRARVWERENGQLGFAQPPRW